MRNTREICLGEREGGRKGGMVEEKRKKSRDYKVGTKSVRNRFKSREKSERWSE